MKRLLIITTLIGLLALPSGAIAVAKASPTSSCGRLTANVAGIHHFSWARHIRATGLTCHAARHALRHSHWTHRGFHSRGFRCHYTPKAAEARSSDAAGTPRHGVTTSGSCSFRCERRAIGTWSGVGSELPKREAPLPEKKGSVVYEVERLASAKNMGFGHPMDGSRRRPWWSKPCPSRRLTPGVRPG